LLSVYEVYGATVEIITDAKGNYKSSNIQMNDNDEHI